MNLFELLYGIFFSIERLKYGNWLDSVAFDIILFFFSVFINVSNALDMDGDSI